MSCGIQATVNVEGIATERVEAHDRDGICQAPWMVVASIDSIFSISSKSISKSILELRHFVSLFLKELCIWAGKDPIGDNEHKKWKASPKWKQA